MSVLTMKFRILFLAMLLLPAAMWATKGRLSPATKVWLKAQHGISVQAQHGRSVEAFVSYSSPAVLDDLERLGAKVNVKFNGFSTVTIPANLVQKASAIEGVKMIDVSHRVHVLTDSASRSTFAKMVNDGVGLPQSYTGKGVVLGVVDVGVDFNHRAFLDDNLHSRIKRVYLPNDNLGKPVEGLPGSEYVGDEILRLKYDDKSSHGTHTLGIAGGSVVNEYRGLAPNADLVVCALGSDLSEVAVVNGVAYIARYAASVGKPCVVNLSLGNHDGPHDGTGFMTRAFEELAQVYPHLIIVLSTGNEGGKQMYVHKSISPDSPLSTFLTFSIADVDVWSYTAKPFYLQFHVYDAETKSVVYTSDTIKSDTIINSDSISLFNKFADFGQIEVYFDADSAANHSRIFITSNMWIKSEYRLALSYLSDEPMELRAWECSGASGFSSCMVPGFTDGTDELSVSDMATGRSTISVGAYVNRNVHTSYQGEMVRDSYSSIGAISSFSSYGTDVNGGKHPYVIAPGTAVISSVNSYLSEDSRYAMAETDAQGRTCYWGAMSGTSMSAPCVAGIVALWQEANPQLTIEQVKSVIAESSEKVDDIRGGHGKINAYQGLLRVLSMGVDEQGLVSSDIQMAGDENSLTIISASAVPVNVAVYALNGQLKAFTSGMGRAEIDIANYEKGVYLVKATCGNGSCAFKFVKK